MTNGRIITSLAVLTAVLAASAAAVGLLWEGGRRRRPGTAVTRSFGSRHDPTAFRD